MGPGRVNRGPDGPSEAYADVHDYTYVHPAVVGRLTAAVHTYVLNGRRLGGRFSLPLLGSRPADAAASTRRL